MVMIIIAFGHSLLSMSGFETLAQVYREIASPKLKNLKIAANIVCVYALVGTGIVTLFAAMIIPDGERPKYFANLIGGLAMNLSGPYPLRLAFHIFVVFVGGLILSGAINTSIIGANGVLNRVAEDGVLVPWFRHPQHKYGTTHQHHQPDHDSAARHHLLQPRQHDDPGGSLRVRRGVEFLLQSPGRDRAALPAPRSGIQDAPQPAHRGLGDSRSA